MMVIGGGVPDHPDNVCDRCDDAKITSPKYITVFVTGTVNCGCETSLGDSVDFVGDFASIIDRSIGWTMLKVDYNPEDANCKWETNLLHGEFSEFIGRLYEYVVDCSGEPTDEQATTDIKWFVSASTGYHLSLTWQGVGGLLGWSVVGNYLVFNTDDIIEGTCVEVNIDGSALSCSMGRAAILGARKVVEYVPPWISGMGYYSNDYVYFEEAIYRAGGKHTSTGGNGPPGGSWIFVEPYNPCYNAVAWDAGTTYVINDRVSHGGQCWRCILGHTNQEPPNATYWEQF